MKGKFALFPAAIGLIVSVFGCVNFTEREVTFDLPESSRTEALALLKPALGLTPGTCDVLAARAHPEIPRGPEPRENAEGFCIRHEANASQFYGYGICVRPAGPGMIRIGLVVSYASHQIGPIAVPKRILDSAAPYLQIAAQVLKDNAVPFSPNGAMEWQLSQEKPCGGY